MSLTSLARRLVQSGMKSAPMAVSGLSNAHHASSRFVLPGWRSLSSAAQSYDTESLGAIVKADKVVVFMKGVPDAPKCGFSNAVVQVLRMHGVPFTSHNVLDSEELRANIKDFTTWPTIPQIFIDGEFIGGCDILLEKHQNGELIDDLLKVGIKSHILKEAAEKSKDDSHK